ncbi:sortase B [Lachnospiraceae bacterium PM6-15]|uniref:class B sortase n=1 Tax=Ohessyouella blattaphilus TaxID=2949333 RepID=UPI003E27E200
MKKVGMVLMVVGLIVLFGYGGYKFLKYKEASTEYEKIQKEYVKKEGEKFPIDVQGLLDTNSEFVAWISIDGVISYPVVKGGDNSHYLYYTYEGLRNNSGAIFMNSENNIEFSDINTVIYGHNMLDNSMFEPIKKYASVEQYQTQPLIKIYTKDKRELTYEVVSFQETYSTSECYRLPVNDTEHEQLLNEIKTKKAYETSRKSLSKEDKILTLSTCKWGNIRYVLQGVLVAEKQYQE